MKNEKKNTCLIKYEKKNIAANLVLLIFFVLFYLYYTNNLIEAGSSRQITLQIILGVVGIISYTLAVLIRKFKLKEHHIFLIASIFMGLVYFIAIPLGKGNDETAHFLRIYEISQKYTTGKFQDSTMLPEQFSKVSQFQFDKTIGYEHYISNYGEFNMLSGVSKDYGNSYWNIRVYSPIQYLPQAIGVTIGRILSDNLLLIGYMGRILGYAFWVTVCCISIKLIPNKKTFFVILCLLPINVISAVCLSGDTVTNAIIMLFIALIYRKMYLDENIKTFEKVLLFVLSVMIALCKIVYLPFIFLILFIDKKNFASKKKYYLYIILLIVVSMIVGLSWLVIGSTIGTNANSGTKEQLEFILTEPFSYLIVNIRTYLSVSLNTILQFATGNELLCHSQVMPYGIISYVVGIICLLSSLVRDDDKDYEISKWKKHFTVCIIVGTILLIGTAIYIQWTLLFDVGGHVIAGLQGRYYIPVAALVVFILDKIKLMDMDKKKLFVVMLLMHFSVMSDIISFYL